MRSVTGSGHSMSSAPLPDWDAVLSAAAHPQTIFPAAVLVGDSAAAVHAEHRMSVDADHVLTDLRMRFDQVLAALEAVAGWKTARIQRPVQILGKLDGIETGIRQLIRSTPLDTEERHFDSGAGSLDITLPTLAEILRIKAVLILRRNATRDYLDFAALSDRLGTAATLEALQSFDALYPQSGPDCASLQLQIQLAHPLPFDLDEIELAEYKQLAPRWQDWHTVVAQCQTMALALFDNSGRQ